MKLWEKFTYPKMYKESTGRDAVISQADIDLFNNSIEPLVRYEKLGALLAHDSIHSVAGSYSPKTSLATSHISCSVT